MCMQTDPNGGFKHAHQAAESEGRPVALMIICAGGPGRSFRPRPAMGVYQLFMRYTSMSVLTSTAADLTYLQGCLHS